MDKPQTQPKRTEKAAEPAVPAAIMEYYRRQNEQDERENALPAYLVRRRRIEDFFLPDDEEE